MPFFVSNFRKIQTFKDCVVEHFCRYKTQYIFLFVVVLSAFLIGLIAGFKKAGDSTLEALPDVVFCKYLQCNITLGQFFLSRFFSFVGMLIFIWLLHFNKWTGLLSITILIYNAFVIGCTSAILISLCRFGGIVNVLLVYLPFHLLTLFCLIVFTAVCINFSFDTCNAGCGKLSMEFFGTIKFVLLTILILQLVGCVLEIILLPWLSSAIIIT